MKKSALLLLPLAICLNAYGHGSGDPGHLGVDKNNNDVSDIYEAQYVVGAFDPHADTDGDGFTNEEEAAAGTDYRKATSVLNVENVSLNGADITATWASQMGKIYRLQKGTSLSGPWISDTATHTGTGSSLTASCATLNGQRLFIRVLVSDVDSDGDGATDWEEIQTGLNPNNWDSDEDGRSDLEDVEALAVGQNIVTVVASKAWLHEGANQTAELSILRRGGFQPLTIPLTWSGSATVGSDYTRTPNVTSIYFAPGERQKNFTLMVLPDAISEGTESITMTLGASSGYTVFNSSATVNISGQGLTGRYFDNSNSTYTNTGNFNPADLKLTRRDANLNFDWLGVAPTPLVNDDTWGAQWSGFLIPKFDETYTLSLIADRGAIVRVSRSPIPAHPADPSTDRAINVWSTTSPTTVHTGPMLGGASATAGQPLYFRVDYRDSTTNPNNSNIQLRWSSASQADEIIPNSAFSTEGAVGPIPEISISTTLFALNGAPFSQSVLANNNPTSYAAQGLPGGLTINGSTGVISGTVTAPTGLYFANLLASNASGTGVLGVKFVVVAAQGTAVQEIFDTPVATDTGVPSVPVWTAASSTNTLNSLESAPNLGTEYGDRIRGTITAPTSGNYQFFISSDENAELWISSNAEPANKLKRSWVLNGNNGIPVGNYTMQTSQTSNFMRMKAGERYYFEVIRRETSGDDHLSVAWKKPGDSSPSVIPSYALSPWTNTATVNSGEILYIANMTPQNGANTLGSGTAILRVNEQKTEATLQFNYANLTGPIISQHIHDFRPVPGPNGAVIYDIDDFEPNMAGERPWVFTATGNHTINDIVAAIEQGQAYINLHTNSYPNGEIRGFFQPVSGSQFFVPPPAPPPAELALPADATQRRKEIVRFLQQASFGAKDDTDGVAPWDPDSIQAVEALGYEGWIDMQLALDPGPNPETMVQSNLPNRVIYREPTPAVPTLIPSGRSIGYNGSGVMATWLKNYYEAFPLSNIGTQGAPLESSNEIYRTWWRAAVRREDQLRMRVAFALSEIMVISIDGELAEQPRALAHYHDLMHWYGLGNFRTLLDRMTLNPAMGRYLDMLNNKEPNPSVNYIPNENFAREIMQLFSIGLRRLHPDGTLVLNSSGLPTDTYGQEEVVGLAHLYTGWIQPGSGSNYVTPMTTRPADHDRGEKLLLNNTVVPAVTTDSAAICDQHFNIAQEMLYQHPNTGPFISRQLIQRMVTVNPSPAYIYRVAKKFENNGSGVRGDMAAVVKAILLDSEARNMAAREKTGFGHLKEPVIRATQMLRALKGQSIGEAMYEASNHLGTVTSAPEGNIDLTQPLPLTAYTRIGNRAIFPGEVITLSGQTPTSDNGLYTFNGTGLPLTAGATGTSVATYSTDLADVATTPIPPTNYPKVEGVVISTNTTLLLRNQTNPSENGIYIYTSSTAPLSRWEGADEPAELNNGSVNVAAYRDPVTLAFSNKTFRQNATVTTVGTDPITFVDGSSTEAGRRIWNMGNTFTAFQQAPLRSPTVFNYFEPDYVFLGETGIAGLYSPEFQITSETSVVNTANWFYELTRLNTGTLSYGQGEDYGAPLRRDIKLDYAGITPLAHDAGALVDYVADLLMPDQMTPQLRTLLVNYINGLPETILTEKSEWKYFTDAAGLGASNIVVGHSSYATTNWKHPNYVDTAWSSGNGMLGYSSNNSGIGTILPYGSDASNKWRTAYFRKEFTVSSISTIGTLTLRLKRDDGAIVYINGHEVRRDGINTGVVATGTTLANAQGDNGAAFFDYVIDHTKLVEGSNVIAVEMHQQSAGSSDLMMDVELRVQRQTGAAATNPSSRDRLNRVAELMYLISLSPEFSTQR